MTTTHTPMATSRSEVDQQRADEQLREAILAKKQAQLQTWSAQIEQMQQGLLSMAENLRGETGKRLAELRQARDQARTQLERLQQATQESWESLLQESDSFFQDVARRFHAFVSRQS